MAISVFDLFKIGIGPSSSHTVGPMRAARMFAEGLRDEACCRRSTVQVCLYGSLGADRQGPRERQGRAARPGGRAAGHRRRGRDTRRPGGHGRAGQLRLLGEHEIGFTVAEHLEFHRRQKLSYHPNGMRFTASGAGGGGCASGPTTRSAAASCRRGARRRRDRTCCRRHAGTRPPYPFHRGRAAGARRAHRPARLRRHAGERTGLAAPAARSDAGLRDLGSDAGVRAARLRHEGLLPGGLKVRAARRRLFRQLTASRAATTRCAPWTG